MSTPRSFFKTFAGILGCLYSRGQPSDSFMKECLQALYEIELDFTKAPEVQTRMRWKALGKLLTKYYGIDRDLGNIYNDNYPSFYTAWLGEVPKEWLFLLEDDEEVIQERIVHMLRNQNIT